jgi:TPR repeat protein
MLSHGDFFVALSIDNDEPFLSELGARDEQTNHICTTVLLCFVNAGSLEACIDAYVENEIDNHGIFKCADTSLNKHVKTFDELIPLIDSYAKEGHMSSMVLMGNVSVTNNKYYDVDKAISCYKKAAVLGSRYAQIRLAEMYDEGKYAKKDHKKALKYYLQANEKHVGWIMAFRIAEMYEKGIGAEVDKNEAVKWYKKAYSSQEELLISLANGCNFVYEKDGGI